MSKPCAVSSRGAGVSTALGRYWRLAIPVMHHLTAHVMHVSGCWSQICANIDMVMGSGGRRGIAFRS
jgi:hypothetical protein